MDWRNKIKGTKRRRLIKTLGDKEREEMAECGVTGSMASNTVLV